MDTAGIGVAQKEDEKQGVDQQDIFYRPGKGTGYPAPSPQIRT